MEFLETIDIELALIAVVALIFFYLVYRVHKKTGLDVSDPIGSVIEFLITTVLGGIYNFFTKKSAQNKKK